MGGHGVSSRGPRTTSRLSPFRRGSWTSIHRRTTQSCRGRWTHRRSLCSVCGRASGAETTTRRRGSADNRSGVRRGEENERIMTDAIDRPEKFFLERFGLTGRTLERTLGTVLGSAIDYADLYFEYRVNEEIGLEEGIVKQGCKEHQSGRGRSGDRRREDRFCLLGRDHGVRLAVRRASSARYIAADSGGRHAWRYGESAESTSRPVSGRGATHRGADPDQDRPARGDRSDRPGLRPAYHEGDGHVASENRLVLVATSEGWVVGDVRPLCTVCT